jgi:putative transcriptional regulator
MANAVGGRGPLPVVLPLAHGFASRAVLVGSSAADSVGRDAIRQRLEDLRDLLVDPVRWGLDRDNCVVLVDPETDELERAVETAGKSVNIGGLVFVHYVGPVRLTPVEGLMFALPGQQHFPYESLRWYVKDSLGAQLVVLDCLDPPAEAAAIADAAIFEGLRLIVHAPAGAREPGLTDRLIDLLDHGVPHGPSRLGLRAVHDLFRDGSSVVVRAGLTDDLALIRNPALHLADREGQIVLSAGGVTRAERDRAVILILRYDKKIGAFGLVLNRPGTEPAPAPNWPGAAHEPEVVFDGGPVAHEGYITLALLREAAEEPAQFRRIGSRLGTLPLTCRPADGIVERCRLFRGYVGWGPDQLEADIADDSVVLAEMDLNVVFGIEMEELRAAHSPADQPL